MIAKGIGHIAEEDDHQREATSLDNRQQSANQEEQ